MSDLSKNEKEFIWEQVYRPQSLSEIILPKDIKDRLESFAAEGRIPSFLFYSPSPGTGKTTAARALCNEIGVTHPLFINASLDNNIETIRAKVVQYATTVSAFNKARIKVVILDECERLSTAAQESLKGVMESVSKNCSFILTTNAKSRLVPPLVSRCRNIDFIWNKEEGDKLKILMCKRVVDILKSEHVEYDPKAVMAVVNRFYPDNRSILGALQDYAQQTGKIDIGIVTSLGGTEFEKLLDILKSKDFSRLTQFVMDNQDILGPDFYGKFFRFVYPDVRVSQTIPRRVTKGVAELIDILGDEQKYHTSTPDPFIHLTRVFLLVMMNDQIVFS